MGLPSMSVRRPVTMLMIYIGICLLGIISLSRLPVELMPNYSFGDVSIIINVRGGMPPVEVESLVTRPVEEAVGTVSNLKDLVSISEEGNSRVVLSFEPGINMDFASLEVREKFAKVEGKLPPEIEKPVIAKFEQADVPIMILALLGKNYTPEMLRKLVDDFIKERFMRVTGVANIDIGGGRERKVLVEVSQDKLKAFKISLNQVISMMSVNNMNLLVGNIEKFENKYLLRVMGEAETVDQIKKIGLAASPSGRVVTLEDLAEVKDSYLEASSYARLNALPVVTMYVQKESSANTVEVVKGLNSEIKKIQEKLADKKVRIVITYDQAESIERAIHTVQKSLLEGAVLSVAILFIFLRSVSSVLVIGIAIPVAMLVTFIFMYFNKASLNIMTLSGLALGSGMLVDNSVVVLDNTFKLLARKVDKVTASIQGSEEMMLAIISSTISTVVVFLPLIFVNEEIRILYSGLALTITFSMISSLFIAITLVPLLTSRLNLLPASKIEEEFGEGRKKKTKSKTMIIKKYTRFLANAIRNRYIVIAIAVVLLIVSMIIFVKGIPKEFIGFTESSSFTVFVELPTGTKVDISDKAVKDIEVELAKIKEIKTFTSRVEGWSSKVYVQLVSIKERSKSIREIIDYLRPKVAEIEKKYKEAFIYFEEQQAAESNEILVEIYGYDYDVLNELAVAVMGRLQTVEGLTDLKIRWRRGRPEWIVKVDKEKAASYGLAVQDVADTVHAAMRGMRASVYRSEGKEVEVVARLQESDRDTLEKVKRLAIPLQDGSSIALTQVADFVPGVGPSKVWRRDKNRMIQVSANRGRYAYGTAGELILKAIADIKVPKDYYFQLGADYYKLQKNQQEMTFALMITLFLIYLVLASLFESYSQPFLIMAAVPLASIGVVATLKLTGKSANMGVFIGIIMLGGIVVNHSIILVDRVNFFRESGMNILKSVLKCGSDRLRPIIMTTLTTTLGLVPMAFDKSEESNLWSPLAVTVIGGLLSSTLLTLVVVPAMYIIFEDARKNLRRLFDFFAPNHIVGVIKGFKFPHFAKGQKHSV